MEITRYTKELTDKTSALVGSWLDWLTMEDIAPFDLLEIRSGKDADELVLSTSDDDGADLFWDEFEDLADRLAATVEVLSGEHVDLPPGGSIERPDGTISYKLHVHTARCVVRGGWCAVDEGQEPPRYRLVASEDLVNLALLRAALKATNDHQRFLLLWGLATLMSGEPDYPTRVDAWLARTFNLDTKPTGQNHKPETKFGRTRSMLTHMKDRSPDLVELDGMLEYICDDLLQLLTGELRRELRT